MSGGIILFVTKFDILKGNIILYQSLESEDLHDIEYKSLASGLHQATFDIVRFTHENNHGQYNGIAVYRQNGMNAEVDSSHRKTVKMYCVGILFDNLYSVATINAVITGLDELFASYINKVPEDLQAQLQEKKFVADLLKRFDLISKQKASGNESLLGSELMYPGQVTISQLFDYIGPYIYLLWRYLLVNKRVLIKNYFIKNSRNSNTINMNTLLINLVDLLACGSGADQGLSTPLYNITLQDTDLLKQYSKSKSGYLACTSDDLLFTKKSLFDYLLEFDSLTGLPSIYKVEKLDKNEHKLVQQTYSDYDYRLFVNAVNSSEWSSKNWAAHIDHSWRRLLGQWLYNYLFSSFNSFGIVEETSSIKDLTAGKQPEAIKSPDDEVENHVFESFNKLLTDYKRKLEEVIVNDDASDDHESDDESEALLNSEEPVLFEYSDVSLLNLNPLISEDRQWVLDFTRLYFNRKSSYGEKFQLWSLQCC